MKAIFVCKEHTEYGTIGLRPKNMPGFDPLDGMGVAHDILEHPAKPDESITGEIQAFGAMMYIRGEDYYRAKGQHTTSPAENFAYELAELLMKAHWGNTEPVRHCKHGSYIRDEEVRREIHLGINKVREALREEWDGELKLDAQTEYRIRGWLAHGYRSARRRYHGVRRYDLLNTFQEIEKKANECLKSGNYGEAMYQGQEMVVELTFKKDVDGPRYPRIRVEVIEEEYYD